MKKRRSLRPALLSAVLMLLLAVLLTASAYASETVTGTISATVRIDYDQTLTELRERQVRCELLQGETSLGAVDLTRPGTQVLANGYTAAVSLRDGAGGTLVGEWPGYLDLSIEGLPRGTYALRFTGTGYVPCQETVDMGTYARHVIVGTGDATFSLGDCNGDGTVDGRDREALSRALGSSEARDLSVYDLNGDGAVDIIDLAYVNRQIAARGGAQLLETTLLAPPVDADALRTELERLGVAVSGDLADLFREDGRVSLRPNGAGEIVLPIAFLQPVELEQVKIVSAAFAPILAGTVAVEAQDGQTYRYSFDNTLPAGVHALSVQEGSNVVTIDLGRRVAVKKITITVTKTETDTAVVETIQFLKEMVPVDPSAAYSQVTGLTASAGSERVSLRWNALPNVSGYRVDWWPVSDPARLRSLTVETNRAEITGLDNLIPYQFTVTAVDGAWTGKTSEPVTATPMPASAPSAPDMVSVTALDGALRVGWKASENATYYEVYYTSQPDAPAGSYTRFGGTLTSTGTTITGLINDTAYYIYIIAGNDAGRSGPSRISTGTPKAVIYERPAGIPSQGVLDWRDFASIRLADPNNYDRGEYASFTPQNMADGDYRTHWTAKNWSSNEHVIVTFKEPQDLSAAIWVPRLDGTYANDLRAYSVQVWYEGENLSGPGHLVTPGEDRGGIGNDSDVGTWPAIRGNPAATKFAVMPFDPQYKVIQISVAAEQRDYLLVTLSELMFLKYDEDHRLPDDIAALFGDTLRTRLVPGVTPARIDALRARLNSDERNYYMELDVLADELDLADELLGGRTSSGVFLSGLDARSGAANDAANFGQGGSALQPLGAAAAAGQEITIYAEGIPEGGVVEVYASQFNAEVNTWRASLGQLENGRNVLTVPRIGSEKTPRGGSLYVTYTGSGGENIRLHIRRTVDIPVLELSHWESMTANERTAAISAYLAELDAYAPAGNTANKSDWRNVTEISTPSVLLSLPAEAVRSALKGNRTAQLENAVLAWEQIMEICREVQGIASVTQARQNVRCMQMFSGAFMYAAGNHIGIGYNSCGGMVSGSPVTGEITSANNLFGWGIAHEIGHNMDKLGKAEITNNIYALAVQTFDGGKNVLPSRLESSGKYAAIFNKTAQSRPGASGDVFVQLGMYWQLHLAYDGGEEPLEFYTKFFTAWKDGRYFVGAKTYNDKVARTAAGVMKTDLTDFFTHWGMELDEDTRATLAGYEKEDRAIWYLNDQSRRERLAGTVRATGSVTAEAERTDEQEITLTFSAQVASGAAVQGYEILRNNVPIAFTTEENYVDTILSGNNRTYQYTVKAYDCLGYLIGEETTEPEILIDYDLLVDTDDYEISQSADGADGMVTVTMKKPTAVSGLRMPAGMKGLNIQVTVVDEDSGTVTVYSGPLTAPEDQTTGEDRFVVYFKLEGDESSNDRIGTYQVKSMTITGLPAMNDLDGDLRLISYAGDDIAFWDESATMGRLAEDYTYDVPDENGGTKTETIKEGTLVIVGTFQGDPMYNTVRIMGDFAAPDLKGGEGDPAVSTEKVLPGTVLLFAQEQEDGRYGTVDKGIFLFIPQVQEETAGSACGSDIVLPARIRAELWRTSDPYGKTGTRCTAQTLWIDCPGGDELPLIVLKGDGE